MDGVLMSRKGLERRSKKYAPVQNVSVGNWYMDAEDFHQKYKTGRVGVKRRMSPAAGGKNRITQKTSNRTMDDRIIELLYRNLQEVFGEGDAARRRAAIQDFYTEDCVLYVPPGVFVGHDALAKFAGDLRTTHPHFVYTPHGEPQALHNGGILAWGSGPKGEAPDYTGLDVVIVRDGKVAALYVFLNPKFA
jgi:SnoaL-like domain